MDATELRKAKCEAERQQKEKQHPHQHQHPEHQQQSGYENNNATLASPSLQTSNDKRQFRQASARKQLHPSVYPKRSSASSSTSASGDDQAASSDDNDQARLNTNKERNDSFNLDRQIKRISLNFTDRNFERQFRSTSDIASCISLVGLPITLLCAFLAHLYLYSV